MDLNEKALSLAFRLLYTGIELENINRHYGTDVELSNTEVHCLKVIKENPGAHITGVAKKIGVSKMAISQLVRRLEKKGLVEKAESIENRSKLELSLTLKGDLAYSEHMKLAKASRMRIREILKQYSEQELKILTSFLKQASESLQKMGEK